METPASTNPTIPSPIFFPRKSREDLLREKVPTIDDLPTKYRPARNYLMIIPLPVQAETEGGIVLPDRSAITYNEGHVVAKGPRCDNETNIGDCITWNPHEEMKLQVEKVSFVLLQDQLVLMKIPITKDDAFDSWRTKATQAEEPIDAYDPANPTKAFQE